VAASYWDEDGGVGGGPKPHGDDLSGFSWLMYECIFFHIPPKKQTLHSPSNLPCSATNHHRSATNRCNPSHAPPGTQPSASPIHAWPLPSPRQSFGFAVPARAVLRVISDCRDGLAHFEVSSVGDSLQSVVKLGRQSRDKGRL
jgi:hypothetical protein